MEKKRGESGMKKGMAALFAVLLLLTACGQNAEAAWQEQYDLGVRYLSEGSYEEAVIAFTAAIDIDPKRADEKMYDLSYEPLDANGAIVTTPTEGATVNWN